MILGETTMTEFARSVRNARTLIVPFGTVEAHGTHLPLNTDTLIIREVVRKVASANDRVFMAPPLQYGVCVSTSMHPGSLSITPGTLRMITTDIVRDAYRLGFRNFILISGHGGRLHVSALREVGESLIKELDGSKFATLLVYDLLGKADVESFCETENDWHAGELETSLMLHLAERLVRGRSKEEYPKLHGPIISRDKLKAWKGAVWGNPAKASKEKGEKLFNIMVEKVDGLVKSLEKSR